MVQHPVQLNLKSVQHWGIHHFPEIILVADLLFKNGISTSFVETI